jgi:GAF domain-containing protein
MAGDDTDELSQLRSRVARLEAQHQAIESENNRLASLFVAAYQLHSTLELREVLQIITEILLNLVGAKTFALYVVDDDGALDPFALDGAPPGQIGRRPAGDAGGVVGRAFAAGTAHFADTPATGHPPDGEPLVAVPLRLSAPRGEEVVGVLAVWDFLQQKRELVDVDVEIFNLLGQSAANALEAALAAAAGTRTRLRAHALREAL